MTTPKPNPSREEMQQLLATCLGLCQLSEKEVDLGANEAVAKYLESIGGIRTRTYYRHPDGREYVIIVVRIISESMTLRAQRSEPPTEQDRTQFDPSIRPNVPESFQAQQVQA